MKPIFFFALALVIGSSCTVRQNFSFDEDFAGEYEMQLDMSKMLAMTGETSTSVLDSINQDSIIEVMNAMDGISETYMREVEGVVRMGYQFEDLSSLNEANSDEGMAAMLGSEVKEGSDQGPIFTWKKKVLTYAPPAYEKPEDSDEETDGAMQSMEGMMKYEIVMRFAKPVKKVSNPDYTISEDKKTITCNMSITDVYEGKNGATTVSF